jgi:carbohydrate kinase (thermoresistant glucokinase family)
MRSDPGIRPIVVMGVSAVGKSTVGSALADRLGVPFIDADDLHPAANVAKMRSGVPLTDADRWPWLDLVGAALAGAGEHGVVLACSALRRAYRDRLVEAAPETFFVHLDLTEAALAERAAARTDHFMPVSLLRSQLAALERLGRDEPGMVVDAAESTSAIVESVVERLGALRHPER